MGRTHRDRWPSSRIVCRSALTFEKFCRDILVTICTRFTTENAMLALIRLDAHDRPLLTLMQEDAMQSRRELAERIHLSATGKMRNVPPHISHNLRVSSSPQPKTGSWPGSPRSFACFCNSSTTWRLSRSGRADLSTAAAAVTKGAA